MKTNAIIRIVCYSIVALLLTGLLLAGLGVGSFITDPNSPDLMTHTEDMDASGIRNLSIDWAAGSITIKTADTDCITITESGRYNETYSMVCSQTGNTLHIRYAKSGFGISIGSIPSKDLVITVPENWVCGEIELDGAALEVDISGITAEKLELDGASMELSFLGQFSELSVDGAACELNVVCTGKPSVIDIDGASCELALTLPKDCGFLVQMDGLGCSFDADVDYRTENGAYYFGDRNCRINVDGLSCDITITAGPVMETLPTTPAGTE